jgi:hypothetical protein
VMREILVDFARDMLAVLISVGFLYWAVLS